MIQNSLDLRREMLRSIDAGGGFSGELMSGKLTRTLSVAVAALLLAPGAARADSGLGPADAEKTLGSLRYLCVVQSLCPLSAANYDTLKRAIAGQRDNQFLLGFNLITGDGVPTDRKAGLEWVVKAAEAGAPLAARYVENKLQNGENIEIDETTMATALKRQADGGDVESMRVLAPMMIRGRGTAQDPQAGIALLLKAAGQGTGGDIEYQIGDLYLIGTNGLPANHEEGMKWYAISASRGNVRAMATLAGLWENEPMMDMRKLMETGRIPKKTFERDIVQSYCWRMRASLMGDSLAHYELALMLSRRNSDSHGNVIEPDLIQADFWFRLGARDREYDNSQVRGAIEPKLTTAQLDQVKKMVADWHKLDFEQMKAAPITIPGNETRTCPPMT
jgi:TPR repeat protein